MKNILKRFFIKLTSSKVLMTIAAVVLLYIIVIGNRTEFKEVAYMLSGIWASYYGVNVLQKYVDAKKNDKIGNNGDEK